MGLSREYLVKGLADKIVSAYYDYMVDLAVIYGADRKRAEPELMDSLNFEIALANVSFCLQTYFRGPLLCIYFYVDLFAERETPKCVCPVQPEHHQMCPRELQLRAMVGLH